MKKILIINLRRLGDVYSTGHLINSLNQSEKVELSMLTYKESQAAAKNLNHLKEVFTINREELITIMNNKLFADSLALEQLYNSLNAVKNIEWDKIIHFSNDSVGAYITSYLKGPNTECCGIYHKENGQVASNSSWDILFNDILTSTRFSPIHFLDCYHKMSGISVNRYGDNVMTSTQFDTQAREQLHSLKEGNEATKLIGIQLSTSSQSKNVSEKTILSLIDSILSNNQLKPVLLIGPFDSERELANRINQEFNGELTIVESDLYALGSVLKAIDLLITPDTVTKHIADLSDCKTLEISIGESPFLKQGSFTAGNYILTDTLANRNFSKLDQTHISARDIYGTILFIFSPHKTITPILGKEVSLYIARQDDLGIYYSLVAGHVDPQIEISRLMNRQTISQIFMGTDSAEVFKSISTLGHTQIMQYNQVEKTYITNLMKDLLATLRSLLQAQESKKNSREFIQNLSRLMAHCEAETLMQIPCLLFKAGLENIQAKTFEENAKQVEIYLYELKSNVQKVLNNIKTLEENVSLTKKEDAILNRTLKEL